MFLAVMLPPSLAACSRGVKVTLDYTTGSDLTYVRSESYYDFNWYNIKERWSQVASVTIEGSYLCSRTGSATIFARVFDHTSTKDMHVHLEFDGQSLGDDPEKVSRELYLFSGRRYSFKAYTTKGWRASKIKLEVKVDGSRLTNSNSEVCMANDCWNGGEPALQCQPTSPFTPSSHFPESYAYQ